MFKLEKVMPRYFLHLWDGDLFEEDDEGTDLPDGAAAREEALRFVQEIGGDLAAPDRALVQVADERGSTVWLLQLSGMASDAPSARGGECRLSGNASRTGCRRTSRRSMGTRSWGGFTRS